MRGRLHGDPTLLIERARSRQVYRTTFSADQRRAIVTEQPDVRDRLCLRLLLDATGNLKAVQKLLGHASIQTTGDIYADWDIDQLAATMADVLAADEDDYTPDSR
jgi:site-specific recombinase XerC